MGTGTLTQNWVSVPVPMTRVNESGFYSLIEDKTTVAIRDTD